MARKTQKKETFEVFLNKNPEVLEQFKNFDPTNLTQPSILLKGGIQEIDVKRLSPKAIEQYLILHPVIPRGIEIKSNRMTSRGYKVLPKTNTSRAKEAAKEMQNLLDSSGGEILINGWIRDAYAFGNGYLVLLPSKDKSTSKIVYISKEHPVFFRIARNKKDKDQLRPEEKWNQANTSGDFNYEWGTMKIDPATKKPTAYTQVVFDNGNKEYVVPVGQELDASQVAHLTFFTWGDEAEGVGIVQYVHTILKYIMNIEEAGAEAIYRSGFTQKVVSTEINTERELKQLARNLRDINASDSIILPRGTSITNLTPGTTEFEAVHNIFLNLLAIRLGVPKPILTLDGTDVNKATMQELMRDLIYDLHADELKVKQAIEEQIFASACKELYGEDFDEVPVFHFNDFEEGKEEKATVMNLTADYLVKLTNAYKTMLDLNQPDVAKRIAEFMISNIPYEKDDVKIKEAGKLISEEGLNPVEKPVEPSVPMPVPVNKTSSRSALQPPK